MRTLLHLLHHPIHLKHGLYHPTIVKSVHATTMFRIIGKCAAVPCARGIAKLAKAVTLAIKECTWRE